MFKSRFIFGGLVVFLLCVLPKSSFAQPTNVGGCGGYLYTSGAGTENILAIKTLLSKNGGRLVSLAECQTVVDNFITRINTSSNIS